MSKIETLVGLTVDVVVDNYTVHGVLEHLDKEKVIIKGEQNFFLIFKDKISMVSFPISESDESSQTQKPKPPTKRTLESQDEKFRQNDIAEKNQYGSILPTTLLEQQPEDPYDRIFSELDGGADNEFSISMSSFSDEKKMLSRSERFKILEKGRQDDSSK